MDYDTVCEREEETLESYLAARESAELCGGIDGSEAVEEARLSWLVALRAKERVRCAITVRDLMHEH